jgi:uncharacterized protein (DUF2345 family)
LLVSSYKINQNASVRDAAGEHAAGIAMLTNADKVAASFSTAAVTHRTVGLAAHLGVRQANASALDDESAPLQAALKTASGMVGIDSLAVARSDATARNISSGRAKVPHTTDPIIAISAQAGFDAVAGQSVQVANGESVALMCGQDSQLTNGGQIRAHTGQVFGILGGAVKSGDNNLGLQIISAKDAVDTQAQADELKVQARDEIKVISANLHIDLASAKRLSLSTAGGANITVDGGTIRVQCPGKIAVHAGKKSFANASSLKHQFPELPRGAMRFDEKFLLVDSAGDPLGNMRYVIIREDGGKTEGTTDETGLIPLQQAFHSEKVRIVILGKVNK